MVSPKKFEDVIKVVGHCDDNWTALAKTWRSLLLGWDDFPDRMEREFADWFHTTAVYKKLDLRLDKQALALSVLTAIETAYTVFITRAFERPHEVYGPAMRLPTFLLCRMGAFLLILAWRGISVENNWIKKSAAEVTNRLWLSCCIIALLMFLSYDALTVQYRLLGKPSNPASSHAGDMDIFSLVFVVIYMLVLTLHPFLFVRSCAFVAHASVVMLLSHFWFQNLFFPPQVKVLFLFNTLLNSFIAHTSEKGLRARFSNMCQIQRTDARIGTILDTLLPAPVVDELRQNPMHAAPPTHTYPRATIAQSDLCGFTQLASTRRPDEVVEFISEIFGSFDELVSKATSIYKVETVGDAYIAGSAGLPLTREYDPLEVVKFGIRMVRATHAWSLSKGENVSCRVGVHTGECIGGIVGTKMQRYHLFGPLLAGVEVLESTAPEGKVQVSNSCKEVVEAQMEAEAQMEKRRSWLLFDQRAEDKLMSSKGDVHDYDEVGGLTYIVRYYSQQGMRGA